MHEKRKKMRTEQFYQPARCAKTAKKKEKIAGTSSSLQKKKE